MLSPKEIEMHISTKTGYAVRALSELAKEAGAKPLSIAEISSRQNLPTKYIEQIFSKLKKKGLISSIHGARGGYVLNNPVHEISLRDIMEAVDENISYSYCMPGRENTDYCSGKPCGFSDLWNEIKEDLDNYFDSIKLDKILERL